MGFHAELAGKRLGNNKAIFHEKHEKAQKSTKKHEKAQKTKYIGLKLT